MFGLDTFNSFLYGTVSEVIQQEIALWNEATHGAIRMIDGFNNIGDTDHETIWKDVPGLVKRRDSYGSGSVDSVQLSLGDLISVKVSGSTPPIDIPPSEFTWIKKSPDEGGVVIGQQLAVAIPQDQLNVGISAAVAGLTAIGAPSAESALDGTLLDISAATGAAAVIDRIVLNDAASYYGDKAQRLKVFLMHSASLHTVLGQNLTNVENLFRIGDVSVVSDAFGRVFIMTDSPALIAGSGVFYTLALAENAIVIESNNDLETNLDTSNGDENILRSFQAEWTFNLGLKGMKYIGATASPTDAVIATPASWSKTVSDIKNSPGVLIKHRNKAA